jgi:hypothetical protein
MLRPELGAELLDFAGDLQRPFGVPAERIQIDHPDPGGLGRLILNVVVDVRIDPPLDDQRDALDAGRDDAAIRPRPAVSSGGSANSGGTATAPETVRAKIV